MTHSSKPIPPVLGFAAFSGVGKTTLLLKLLPLLCERGLCVGMIKHAHHNFDIDKPGKDSFELRKAGAQQMLVTSNQRWALMVEREYEQEPKLDEHIAHLDYATLDLILVEGFKHGRFPKIELHRPALHKPLLFPEDEFIVAVASDSPLILPDHIERLDLNDEIQIMNFICSRFLSHLFRADDREIHGGPA
ncbi:MAG TPA: molybdopterin-guanine dinucleotide biosynthesis protein B [Gammaproteobacteria bacterium]